MSTAICTSQDDAATPLRFASPHGNYTATLKLVVDNTTTEPLMPACCEAITEAATLPQREQDLKVRTAHTYVGQINVGRQISRKDQEHVMHSLKKYGKTILAVVFRGSTIQFAVSLRNIDKSRHDSYPAAIRADIARAFPLTRSFDTGRELTPERCEAIAEALKWAKHLITSISFNGKTVHYAITIGATGEKYQETVQRAIEGDMFMAARHGGWS